MTSAYSEGSDLALTLDAVAKFLRRYVVITETQATALALWIAHTHAFDAADCTSYIYVSSPLKRCGKSLLLALFRLLVREPLSTVNISDAALFRAIAKLTPTVLLDEADTVFGPKARDREDLRGLLNAGFERGAKAWRMGGSNNSTLESFEVFCPKALAGIGDLPDTIADRTIRIRLERRTRDEPIERFRRRDVVEQAEPIRLSLESLAEHHLPALTYARPALPDELDDRAQDVWEPLLAIADLAGGDWPARARAAAIALSTGEDREDDSLGSRLLADIRAVFEANGTQRYRTADLITELCKVEESPWGDWFGKPISAQGLSKLLKPYRIRTMPVWIDGGKHVGYKVEQFENAWLRVLDGRDGRDGRSGSSIDAAPTAPTAPTVLHAAGSNGRVPVPGDPDAGRTLDEALQDEAWVAALVDEGIIAGPPIDMEAQ